ncbi:MAG: hemolysin family protein [Candidatus Omnitrophota bacterium]
MDIVVFISLLFFSAFFSGSETAFLSLDKIRLKHIESRDDPSARRVVKLLADPHKLLVTILVGNTLVNIAASSILSDLIYGTMGEKGVGVSIVFITILLLIFGEVTPKMFARANDEKVAFFVSLPLIFMERLFLPFQVVFTNTAYAVVRGLGIKVSPQSRKITTHEIKSLFSMGKKKGVVKEKEKDMIDSILEFKELNAADIMTPRINIAALDLTKKQDDLIRDVKEYQFSRLPVYIHTLDNIVGIIHAKDFLLNPDVPVRNIVKKPFFAPESMRIDDLLRELQREHRHMAVVTDEYGVTSGVVTMEDMLEEIVGEIRDELDFESPKIRKIDQKSYEVSGQAHIDEVNEEIGLSIETDEVDTIGGYAILRIGKSPRAGDKVEINGFVLTIKDVSKNRITTLMIERKETRNGEGPEINTK